MRSLDESTPTATYRRLFRATKPCSCRERYAVFSIFDGEELRQHNGSRAVLICYLWGLYWDHYHIAPLPMYTWPADRSSAASISLVFQLLNRPKTYYSTTNTTKLVLFSHSSRTMVVDPLPTLCYPSCPSPSPITRKLSHTQI